MSRRQSTRERCTETARGTGERCKQWPIRGTTVCYKHGGQFPRVRAKADVLSIAEEYAPDGITPGRAVWAPNGNAHCLRKMAVKAALVDWGPTDTKEDPGEILLRLVAQSSRRVALYSDLLQQQYDKAAEGEGTTELPAGVSALIGHKYALNKFGDAVPVEEAIRGLVELELKERELCSSFASKAVAAGLAERQVRIAERQGALIAQVLKAVIEDTVLGLSDEQRRKAPDVIRSHLRAITS